MAAPSPALTSNSSDAVHTAATATATTTTAAAIVPSHRTDGPPKTLRGLNKPKCIQCGNVARSRCPYQSCKSCCSKAQNPCHIHVLKANATFPEKAPASSSTLFDHQSTEASPASSSLRVASLRQLSNNFSQFNNLHASRSRKPLTRKEAAAINEWRFSKLKEYRERNIEVENEAFGRYMQNINLLEEVFSVKSILESSEKGSTEDTSLSSNPNDASAEVDTKKLMAGQKLKLRSSPTKSENVRKRIQEIVDAGLKKLQKREFNDGVNLNGDDELDKRSEKAKSLRADRASALNDLIEKLNKARNEEDLTSCLDMKAQLYSHHGQTETRDVEVSIEGSAINNLSPTKELDYLSQKLFRTVEIDQESLNSVSAHFSSLQKIANL
ncbi:hypothetical protein P3X46_026135 [Hevea brasiliensis]|uniref:HIT-type domain-containing protein n=1 Tax=Hevea brasiliensis TaxID=3981 RepID=A0ABQ9KVM2_HEVBR|nr:uncharacterized protein LOC110650343 [Hevea brasiliensis]KAJ9152580.1 hypothetical protein P3X46_026135 [Hevea brasiliensis]